MANKDIKTKRKEKALKKLDQAGRLVNGVEIPKGSLAACPHQQKADGYALKHYYKDIQYRCESCGENGVWTAQQQKKYFEEQKGNIYNQPKWYSLP